MLTETQEPGVDGGGSYRQTERIMRNGDGGRSEVQGRCFALHRRDIGACENPVRDPVIRMWLVEDAHGRETIPTAAIAPQYQGKGSKPYASCQTIACAMASGCRFFFGIISGRRARVNGRALFAFRVLFAKGSRFFKGAIGDVLALNRGI